MRKGPRTNQYSAYAAPPSPQWNSSEGRHLTDRFEIIGLSPRADIEGEAYAVSGTRPRGTTRGHAAKEDQEPEPLLLFLDGSGHQKPPLPYGSSPHDHYAIAGLLATPGEYQELHAQVETLIADSFPGHQTSEVEIHAYEIMCDPEHRPPPEESDRFWDHVPGPDRGKFTEGIRKILLDVEPIVVGRVINKRQYYEDWITHPDHTGNVMPEPPAVNALRFLLKQVHDFLEQTDQTAHLIMDEDTLEASFEQMIANVRTNGHNRFPFGRGMGRPRHFSRILDPEFIDSEASRGVQLADLTANYMWRAFEYDQGRCWKELLPLRGLSERDFPPAITVGGYKVQTDARTEYLEPS